MLRQSDMLCQSDMPRTVGMQEHTAMLIGLTGLHKIEDDCTILAMSLGYDIRNLTPSQKHTVFLVDTLSKKYAKTYQHGGTEMCTQFAFYELRSRVVRNAYGTATFAFFETPGRILTTSSWENGRPEQTLSVLLGNEDDVSDIIAMYRKYLYQNMSDVRWLDKMRDTITFAIHHQAYGILGAHTMKLCHTVFGEPVLYSVLIAKNLELERDLVKREEMKHVSMWLKQEAFHYAKSLVPPHACAAHMLTQSVGYSYRVQENRVKLNQVVSDATIKRASDFWNKIEQADDAALSMGAQLSLVPNFAEGDCRFLHTELRVHWTCPGCGP